METTFARWLRGHGESHSAFAIRVGVVPKTAAALAGVQYRNRPVKGGGFSFSVLSRIAAETGIPAETLNREGTEAAKNPLSPRRYTRKEEPDGKAAAE